MLLQYCSDLHFNNPLNIEYFKLNGLKNSADILILGGDISFLNYLDRPFEKEFFNRLSGEYEKVYYLLGNSEFYGGWDTILLDAPLAEKMHSNVLMVNNFSEEICGHRFVFSTMWSEISLEHENAVIEGSHDFEFFLYKGSKISRSLYNKWHAQALKFINDEISLPRNGELVVVTHHMPSETCSSDRWSGSPLNDVFVAKQDNLVAASGAKYWLYGHSHENRHEFNIGNTVLLTNQLAENTFACDVPFRTDAILDL